ncbi:MAG: hypothetical protein V1855_05100, partial [bacterium]
MKSFSKKIFFLFLVLFSGISQITSAMEKTKTMPNIKKSELCINLEYKTYGTLRFVLCHPSEP